jgi:hypothetical protein
MCKQPVINTKSEEEGECVNTSAPTLHQILRTTMAMRCCSVLKQTDTVLKLFWSFTVNSWPHLILQECAVILAIDHFTNWQGIVKHKSILAQEHDMHDFQCTMTAQYNFFSLVTFGHTTQHSVISAEGQMNASMTHQLLHVIAECTAFFSTMLQVGGGKKNMHGSFVIIEHAWNPLSTNFSLPQAVSENTVYTCWRDSNFCSNCRA